MLDLQLSTSLLFCLLCFLFLFILSWKSIFKTFCSSKSDEIPRSYPFIGSALAIYKNSDRQSEWMADLVKSTPSATFVLHRTFGSCQALTGNPSNVRHILKTHFQNYPEGPIFGTTLSHLLGDGIFNADGDGWKFQRQVASHEFNTKTLRKFIETVVDIELCDRLVPTLSGPAASRAVVDL